MSLSPETIEDIVHGRTLAPPGYRHLTLERQLEACAKFLAFEQSKIDPMKVVEVDEAVLDAQGRPKIGKDSYPVIERRKRFARDVATDVLHWVKQAERVRAEYRAWLSVDPAQRHEQQERAAFDADRRAKRIKLEQHEAAEAAKAQHRDSNFMLNHDRG